MDIEIVQRSSAFRTRIKTIALVNKIYDDEHGFLNACVDKFSLIIEKSLNKYFFLKVNTNLLVEFVKKIDGVADGVRIQFFIQSNAQMMSNETNINHFFLKNVHDFHLKKIEDFVRNGSGWILDKVIELLLTISRCEHFRHGSSFIEISEVLRRKKAIINVKNLDNECFKWAVLSALYPAKKKCQSGAKLQKAPTQIEF